MMHRVKFKDPETGRLAAAEFYEESAWRRFADLLAENGYENVYVEEVVMHSANREVYRP